MGESSRVESNESKKSSSMELDLVVVLSVVVVVVVVALHFVRLRVPTLITIGITIGIINRRRRRCCRKLHQSQYPLVA